MEKLRQFVDDETSRCIRCGYCLPTCPTYAVTGLESAVARGRNYYARQDELTGLRMNKRVKEAIKACLLCGACVDNCAPKVQTDKIMVAVRSENIQKNGQPPLQRFVFRELLMQPERMTRLMKLISFGKRTGISGLAKALSVFGWFGKNVAGAESLVQTFPKKFMREYDARSFGQIENPAMTVAYFMGCGINYAFPNVGLTTLKLLNRLNIAVHVIDHLCCGLPAFGYGDMEAARTMARSNIDAFSALKVDAVITECGSCASFLHDYPKLFESDQEMLKRAEAFSAKVYNLTHFLYHKAHGYIPEPSEKLVVTYHDPCHLSHHLHVTEEPRELLKQMNGIEYRELPEANWCCGGAGTYNITNRELSSKILSRKMDNVKKTGADVLLTACPGCMIQLAYGVRTHGLPVKVMHINELLYDFGSDEN